MIVISISNPNPPDLIGLVPELLPIPLLHGQVLYINRSLFSIDHSHHFFYEVRIVLPNKQRLLARSNPFALYWCKGNGSFKFPPGKVPAIFVPPSTAVPVPCKNEDFKPVPLPLGRRLTATYYFSRYLSAPLKTTPAYRLCSSFTPPFLFGDFP